MLPLFSLIASTGTCSALSYIPREGEIVPRNGFHGYENRREIFVFLLRKSKVHQVNGLGFPISFSFSFNYVKVPVIFRLLLGFFADNCTPSGTVVDQVIQQNISTVRVLLN